jgi:hypothetical protein
MLAAGLRGSSEGESHEWERGGVKYKSIKIGTHWYSVRVAGPQTLLPIGPVAQFLVSGRWRCKCGRRHRATTLACLCGTRAPAAAAGGG